MKALRKFRYWGDFQPQLRIRHRKRSKRTARFNFFKVERLYYVFNYV